MYWKSIIIKAYLHLAQFAVITIFFISLKALSGGQDMKLAWALVGFNYTATFFRQWFPQMLATEVWRYYIKFCGSKV